MLVERANTRNYGDLAMVFIEDLKKVSQLFSGTFCRDFIVYGSNVIPSIKNELDHARSQNETLYEHVSSRYLLDDTISKYFNPAWQYAFDTVYVVDDCRYHMASYWDFRCILAAASAYEPNLHYRYTTMYDRLCSFMVLNPITQKELMKKLTLLFGDYLQLLSRVAPWVEKMVPLTSGEITELLFYKWISLKDLPKSYLESFDKPLASVQCSMLDLAYLNGNITVYGPMEIDVNISDIVRAIDMSNFGLFDEIDRLFSEVDST